MLKPPCTCGCTEAHEVARRKTADGATVILWSDGGVSTVRGASVWGDAARSTARHTIFMKAGWLLMGEVCLYDAREMRKLVKTARRACEQQREAPLAYLRRVMAGRPYTLLRPEAWRSGEGGFVSITEYDERTGFMLRHRSIHKPNCQCIACLRGRMQAGLGLR